jgi:hypothetical protein
MCKLVVSFAMIVAFTGYVLYGNLMNVIESVSIYTLEDLKWDDLSPTK